MKFLRYLTIIAFIMHGQSIMAMKALAQKQADVEFNEERRESIPKGGQLKSPPPVIIRKYSYAPRAMLIYLDDTEGKATSAIGLTLHNAIDQKSGPIIASLHTLKLLRKQLTNLVGDAWIIKLINNDMSLLLPIPYLESIGIDPEAVKTSESPKITETELALGIKVNHMETKTFAELPLPTGSSQPKLSDYFLPALYNSDTETSSIFCLRSDYTEYKKDLPLWSLYMTGHGESAQRIVGISLDDFKHVLDFLNTKINTRLLFYVSCYAAGTNNEKIYRAAKDPIEKTYGFPIITQALTDAPVTSRPAKEQPQEFVKAVMQGVDVAINYETLISYFNTEQWMTENTAQIKLPGLEWFSVINAKKNIVQIGSILAKNRGNRPLDIASFFKTQNPRVLLLYTQHIPFELLIYTNALQAIVSMTPGDTIHTLKEISSSSYLDIILNWFMSIDSLGSGKIFYIKSIHATGYSKPNEPTYAKVEDVIICNLPPPPTYERFAFFKENGVLYVNELGKFKRIEDNSPVYSTFTNKRYSKEMYEALLAEVKRSLPQ